MNKDHNKDEQETQEKQDMDETSQGEDSTFYSEIGRTDKSSQEENPQEQEKGEMEE